MTFAGAVSLLDDFIAEPHLPVTEEEALLAELLQAIHSHLPVALWAAVVQHFGGAPRRHFGEVFQQLDRIIRARRLEHLHTATATVCRRTGKHCHASQGAAQRHLTHLREDLAYRGGEIYRCHCCGSYHVGTRPGARTTVRLRI